MSFYSANELVSSSGSYEGSWTVVNDVLTYTAPSNKEGSLTVTLASRYSSDNSEIIDIDGTPVSSFTDSVSVTSNDVVSVIPTLTGPSALGVEVMYSPTESLTPASTEDYAGELDSVSGTGGAVDNNPTTSLYNASRIFLKGSDAGTGGQGFNILKIMIIGFF